MSTKGLYSALSRSLTSQEALWLISDLPDGPAIVGELPDSGVVGTTRFFHSAAEALHRRGYRESDICDRLQGARLSNRRLIAPSILVGLLAICVLLGWGTLGWVLAGILVAWIIHRFYVSRQLPNRPVQTISHIVAASGLLAFISTQAPYAEFATMRVGVAQTIDAPDGPTSTQGGLPVVDGRPLDQPIKLSKEGHLGAAENGIASPGTSIERDMALETSDRTNRQAAPESSNLSLTAANAQSHDVYMGDWVIFSYLVENHGSTAVVAPEIAIYYSLDTRLDSDDHLVCSGYFDQVILAHQRRGDTIGCDLPEIQAGEYYAFAVVNPNNLLPETSQSDNFDFEEEVVVVRGY